MNARILLIPILALAPAAAEVKVFEHFTLIDGNGGAPQRDTSMIVDNGRIQWIGPAASLKAPAGAEDIDATGKFIMPGIINLHGHVGNVIGLKQDAKYFTLQNINNNLNTYASYGVTTVLSMGTEQDLIYQVRAQQRAGRPQVARIYTAGRGFVFKGGYGGMKGVTYEVETPEEVAKDVDELARHHPDVVKMWVDDHLGHMKKMPLNIAKAVIDSGHRHNLKVAAHIFYLDDAKSLAAAGVDGLAHSVRDKPVDAELIETMKRHNTWQLAATLTREESVFVYANNPAFLNEPFFGRALSPETLAALKSPEYQTAMRNDPDFARYPGFLKTAEENLKKEVDGGVKYGFGTDSGPPGRFPGYFEQWELELEVKAGLTPMQAIQGATKHGAEFLGAADLGTLEVRKWADMLVLDKNPLDDIRNTRTLSAVYIAGNKLK